MPCVSFTKLAMARCNLSRAKQSPTKLDRDTRACGVQGSPAEPSVYVLRREEIMFGGLAEVVGFNVVQDVVSSNDAN